MTLSVISAQGGDGQQGAAVSAGERLFAARCCCPPHTQRQRALPPTVFIPRTGNFCLNNVIWFSHAQRHLHNKSSSVPP